MLSVPWSGLALAQPADSNALAHRVDRALAAGKQYLLGQFDANGQCREEFPASNPRFGGKTALCTYALLSAGVKPVDPVIRKSIRWLLDARIQGTYAITMRICAVAALNDSNYLPQLTSDAQWLITAADQNGAYSYASAYGQPQEQYDNSNAQIAALGVWTAASRGVEVPPAYWRQVERYWLSQQQFDGGWGYRIPPKAMQTKTYGSMTAAGLATLYLCFDNLRRDDFLRCTATGESKPILDAMKWMDRNFVIDENPGKGVEWHYYWLYSLQRVGMASGQKTLAGHDWYTEGANWLIPRQNEDGSWHEGDRLAQSAFAVLFLARGNCPILVNKLRYEGKWNSRPRDAANLSRWVSTAFERPMNWQIVDMDASLNDWHDAAVLYISGAGTVEFSDAQKKKLKRFVEEGGLIVSEAACNNGDFSIDMQNLYKQLFPDYPMRKLSDMHPVYMLNYKILNTPGLMGVSNGMRLLAIHAPRELSLALQGGMNDLNRPTFQLMTNLCIFATDRGIFRDRGQNPWPQAAPFTPVKTIRLARVKAGPNYNPEPLALQRLALVMGNDHGIKLELSDFTEIPKLDASAWPVAYFTGTDAFELSGEELVALKKYLNAGGTLLVESAGGSEAFTGCVEKQVLPLLAPRPIQMVPIKHPLYASGPYKFSKISYRRDYSTTLTPEDRVVPLMDVAMAGNKVSLIFTRDDLSAALVGYSRTGIRGYSPQIAPMLLANILNYLSEQKK